MKSITLMPKKYPKQSKVEGKEFKRVKKKEIEANGKKNGKASGKDEMPKKAF